MDIDPSTPDSGRSHVTEATVPRRFSGHGSQGACREPGTAIVPAARIKRILDADYAIGPVSGEALFLLSRSMVRVRRGWLCSHLRSPSVTRKKS